MSNLTKKELSQLYYLKKEIKQQQKRIDELKNLAGKCTSQLTGFPLSKDVVDRVGKYTAQIVDLQNLLDLNLKKCFYELNRLEHYIQSVEDSQMRTILSLRYVHGLSFYSIAKHMYYQDESVPRKRLNRFFRKIKNDRNIRI